MLGGSKSRGKRWVTQATAGCRAGTCECMEMFPVRSCWGADTSCRALLEIACHDFVAGPSLVPCRSLDGSHSASCEASCWEIDGLEDASNVRINMRDSGLDSGRAAKSADGDDHGMRGFSLSRSAIQTA